MIAFGERQRACLIGAIVRRNRLWNGVERRLGILLCKGGSLSGTIVATGRRILSLSGVGGDTGASYEL